MPRPDVRRIVILQPNDALSSYGFRKKPSFQGKTRFQCACSVEDDLTSQRFLIRFCQMDINGFDYLIVVRLKFHRGIYIVRINFVQFTFMISNFKIGEL